MSEKDRRDRREAARGMEFGGAGAGPAPAAGQGSTAQPANSDPFALLRAAERAAGRLDLEQARTLLDRFDTIQPKPGDALTAARYTRLRALAQTDAAAREHGLRSAADLFRQLGAALRAQECLGALGAHLISRGQAEGAALARIAAAAVGGTPDPCLRAEAYIWLAQALSAGNDPDGARGNAAEAFRIATAARSTDPERAAALAGRAADLRARQLAQHSGDDAAEWTAAAAEAYRAAGSTPPAAAAEAPEPAMPVAQVNREAAPKSATPAAADPAAAADAHAEAGAALLREGNAEAAIPELAAAVAAYAELDDPRTAAAQADLAQAYDSLGRTAEAQRVLEEAVEHTDDDLRLGKLHGKLGAVLYNRDSPASAARHYLAAADAYARAGDPAEEAEAQRLAVLALRHAGKPEAAFGLFGGAEQALSSLPEGSNQQQRLRGHWESAAAQVLADLGRVDEAADRALASAAALRGLGNAAWARAELQAGGWLRDLGRLEAAEEAAQRILATYPEGSREHTEATELAAILDQNSGAEASGQPDAY